MISTIPRSIPLPLKNHCPVFASWLPNHDVIEDAAELIAPAVVLAMAADPWPIAATP